MSDRATVAAGTGGAVGGPQDDRAGEHRPRRAPQARPEQILDAATEILLTKGLLGMTMDEIAGTAGLAKGTTYLYFKSKAQVLAALRIRHVQRMLEACTAAAAAGRPVPTIVRVERFVETVWDFTVANAPLLQLLFHEAGGDDGTEIGMTCDGLMVYVREGMASGEFAVRDPDTIVSFLVHGMHGAFASGLHGSPAARRDMLKSVKAVFRRQLLGD
ncbi:MAG: TetR/AcrR family transcriptional regulator [Catenulispora sp.]